ncbi:hypothetical protein WJ968_31725 [Achromobacter xylosoxidans]
MPPAKLTAVVAPIGYGKTVLLSTLYQDRARWDQASWWFCLDERDITLDRLLDGLQAKFEMPEGGRRRPASEATTAMHQGASPTASAFAE